jgi:hypothetical protein
MRPQNVLIGFAINLAARRDKPAGFIPDRLPSKYSCGAAVVPE